MTYSRPIMPLVYRGLLAASALTWTVAVWSAPHWFDRILYLTAAVTLACLSWFNTNHSQWLRMAGVTAATFAGLNRAWVLILIWWGGEFNISTLPGVSAWLTFTLYTVLLAAFGWVPSRVET